MDLICPKCLEPWDFDTIHEVAKELNSTFENTASRFRTLGCGPTFKDTSFGGSPCEEPTSEKGKDRSAVASALADLLGDDMDGYAAMMEDFDLTERGLE